MILTEETNYESIINTIKKRKVGKTLHYIIASTQCIMYIGLIKYKLKF